MKNYIYYTKQGKFETDNYFDISLNELHSPNNETPALITPSGTKYWCFNGEQHKLEGPSVIFNDKRKYFHLNGICYELDQWLKLHPNQDETFQAIMKLKYT